MTISNILSADQIIKILDMKPHPEGGFYAETFRDKVTDEAGRAASTLIYFLLPEGVLSRWHKVDAVGTWHYYAGAPLELSISADSQSKDVLTLGPDLLAGERPQGIVPRATWQQARSLGDWTLVGCTVAPGFSSKDLNWPQRAGSWKTTINSIVNYMIAVKPNYIET